VGLTILITVVLCFAVSAADDPQMGTWNVNLTKSKYSPGFPIPRSQTQKHEQTGCDGMTYIQDGLDETGKPVHVEYTANYDGKVYPVYGDPNRDTVALKQVSAYETKGTSKKGGKVVGTFTRVVSKDGRVLTITSKGTRNGKRYNNVVVYDKQ
jgi:hypothetical protein